MRFIKDYDHLVKESISMYIQEIKIRNFKKLKRVTLNLHKEQSIFVGANNSGKTTAMEALQKFLTRGNFSIYDFSIGNWKEINGYFEKLYAKYRRKKHINSIEEWLKEESVNQTERIIDKVYNNLPQIYFKLHVKEEDLYRVLPLIYNLENLSDEVGICYRYEPSKLDDLVRDYIEEKNKRNKESKPYKEEYKEAVKKYKDLNMRSFLEWKGLNTYFSIASYVAPVGEEEIEAFQFPKEARLTEDPLTRLLKVDIIGAQRGLSDNEKEELVKSRRLSTLFANYYKEFKFDFATDHSVWKSMQANVEAEQLLKGNLGRAIEPLEEQLEEFGYPGFGSPKIEAAPVIDIMDTMNRDSSILFRTGTNTEDSNSLPEQNNGLGYQNLISIYLQMMYFIEERKKEIEKSEAEVRPLHLLLIEEPEAHLHPQAQKVFINRALELIQKSLDNESLRTQLIVSTHSSHIADHVDLENLLYFKREKVGSEDIASVISLSKEQIYDDDRQNRDRERKNFDFVQRYLHLAEHDVLFADAFILVEGAVERILLPEMIRQIGDGLQNKYISILEVGGRYANKFFKLLDALGRPYLVITDIDTVRMKEEPNPGKKEPLKVGSKVFTSNVDDKKTTNDTLTEWFSTGEGDDLLIPMLLNKKTEEKIEKRRRIAYQYVEHKDLKEGVIGYARTFEDDFALENIEFFKEWKESTGLVKKFHNIFNDHDLTGEEVIKSLFEAITSDAKSDFALDVLYREYTLNDSNNGPRGFKVPLYIREGLEWLNKELQKEVNQL